MKTDLKVCITPTKKHLLDIDKWTIEDNQSNGTYYDSEYINSAFNRNDIYVLTKEDFAIGFIVFLKSNLVLDIKLAGIKYEYRGRKYGSMLINETLNHFKNEGVLVSELYCSPVYTEYFWARLGFLKFSKEFKSSRVRMYKPLIKTEELLNSVEKGDDIIKLTNSYSKNKTYWTWKLKFKNNTSVLINPIVYPSLGDWEINWKNNLVKAKNFNLGKNFQNQFIIIQEL